MYYNHSVEKTYNLGKLNILYKNNKKCICVYKNTRRYSKNKQTITVHTVFFRNKIHISRMYNPNHLPGPACLRVFVFV